MSGEADDGVGRFWQRALGCLHCRWVVRTVVGSSKRPLSFCSLVGSSEWSLAGDDVASLSLPPRELAPVVTWLHCILAKALLETW
jgi:hypothetical protein